MDQGRLQRRLQQRSGRLGGPIAHSSPDRPLNRIRMAGARAALTVLYVALCVVCGATRAAPDPVAAYGSFVRWLVQRGVEPDLVPSTRLEGRDVIRGARLSRFARPRAGGDIVQQVPAHVLISHSTMALTAPESWHRVRTVLEVMYARGSPTLESHLCGIALFLALETARGDSQWRPYLDMLPRRPGGGLYFTEWESQLVAEVRGSSPGFSPPFPPSARLTRRRITPSSARGARCAQRLPRVDHELGALTRAHAQCEAAAVRVLGPWLGAPPPTPVHASGRERENGANALPDGGPPPALPLLRWAFAVSVSRTVYLKRLGQPVVPTLLCLANHRADGAHLAPNSKDPLTVQVLAPPEVRAGAQQRGRERKVSIPFSCARMVTGTRVRRRPAAPPARLPVVLAGSAAGGGGVGDLRPQAERAAGGGVRFCCAPSSGACGRRRAPRCLARARRAQRGAAPARVRANAYGGRPRSAVAVGGGWVDRGGGRQVAGV